MNRTKKTFRNKIIVKFLFLCREERARVPSKGGKIGFLAVDPNPLHALLMENPKEINLFWFFVVGLVTWPGTKRHRY
jgi:hypothetical protein